MYDVPSMVRRASQKTLCLITGTWDTIFTSVRPKHLSETFSLAYILGHKNLTYAFKVPVLTRLIEFHIETLHLHYNLIYKLLKYQARREANLISTNIK
jgi:hypothetical protein